MERSRHIAAYLSGEPVAAAEVPRLYASGKAGSAHVSQAEYARAVAEIAANRRANRYDPRTTPYKAVEIDQLAIPFLEIAHVR